MAVSTGSQQGGNSLQRHTALVVASRDAVQRSADAAPPDRWAVRRPAAQRAEPEPSAEMAAASPEAVATQLAAVAAGLSQAQLRELFLSVLTGSPLATPQHVAGRDRQAGGSQLAQIPEDDVLFWVGEIDPRFQPADGRTQLLLVAGPFPDLAAALNSLPSDRQVPMPLFVCSYMPGFCIVGLGEKPDAQACKAAYHCPAGRENHRAAATELYGMGEAQLIASRGTGRTRRESSVS